MLLAVIILLVLIDPISVLLAVIILLVLIDPISVLLAVIILLVLIDLISALLAVIILLVYVFFMLVGGGFGEFLKFSFVVEDIFKFFVVVCFI